MIDQHSETWLAVKAHCESLIEAGRGLLERQAMSESDTVFERGAIKALRGVLALASPPEPTPPPRKKGDDLSGY